MLVHFLDALRVYMTKEVPHLLYQACIDPTSYYSIPFYKMLPFHVTMTFIYVGVGTYSNIYLYMFLRYNMKYENGATSRNNWIFKGLMNKMYQQI